MYVDWETSELVVDKEYSSLNPSAYSTRQAGVLDGIEEAVSLHIFLDASVLEIIADDRVALTTRLYPTREDSTSVQVFSKGRGRIDGLTVWRLGSIW